MKKLALTLISALIGLCLLAAPALAGSNTDVHSFGKEFCQTNGWVWDSNAGSATKVHDSPYYSTYDAHGTCITVPSRYSTGFRIDSDTIGGWSYPNTSAGQELAPNGGCPDRAHDVCFHFPVQVGRDGNPAASASAYLAPGTYNYAFDIWISPASWQSLYTQRAGDTELMIWMAHPGISDRFNWYVTLDGMRFGVMTWEARHGGISWRYVAYVALSTHASFSGVQLNSFYANARAHRLLTSSEWVQAIDLGFELLHGGVGTELHWFELYNAPPAHPVTHKKPVQYRIVKHKPPAPKVKVKTPPKVTVIIRTPRMH